MKRAALVLVALMGLVPTAALAHGSDGHPADPNLHVNPSLKDCSVQFAPELTQDAFARFAREFGSVSAFKMMAPPAPLGKWKFAIGIEQMNFTVEEHADAWNDTFAHPDAYHELGSEKSIPKLRIRAGLTDRLDVGAYYSENPNANYGWLGLEAKYGLLRQSDSKPVSLAMRGAYTKTLYVDDMDMNAFSADLAAGHTFRNVFTPYLGVGSDLVLVRETSNVVDLHSESQLVPHALAGCELRLWHVALGAEVNRAALTSLHMQVTALF
jgi:opacity protein-like surface antigen